MMGSMTLKIPDEIIVTIQLAFLLKTEAQLRQRFGPDVVLDLEQCENTQGLWWMNIRTKMNPVEVDK